MEKAGLVARVVSWLPSNATLDEHQFRTRHTLIVRLLLLHLPGLAIVGVLRAEAPAHIALETAVFPLVAVVASRLTSRVARSVVASLGLMYGSGLLIHYTDGLIESHFHIFAMLGFVALYQHWAPYLGSIVFTAVHHLGASLLQVDGAFNHPAAQEKPVLWALIHAGWVLLAATGQVLVWRTASDAYEQSAIAAERLREQERGELERREAAARADVAAAERRRAEREALEHDVGGKVSSIRAGNAKVRETLKVVAGSVEDMVVGAYAVADHARDASEVVVRGVAATRSTVERLEELSRTGDEVASVVADISAFASQTNLLALNAAIEAARAGAGGAGFAVVADEVKDLANEISADATRVEEAIETLRNDIGLTGARLEEAAQLVDRVEHLHVEIQRSVEEQTASAAKVSSSLAEVAAHATIVRERVEEIEQLVSGGSDPDAMSGDPRNHGLIHEQRHHGAETSVPTVPVSIA